jgi:succinate dehydrogenase / fumarate reductase membrane anchor subunit
MVTNITSLTGSGLKDWFIQRVTALYFAIYSLCVLGYLIWHPQLSYEAWHTLFACSWVKIASLLALLALSLHAWIGIWTVTTDYLKHTALRISLQLLVMAGLLSQFIWGVLMLWGQSI